MQLFSSSSSSTVILRVAQWSVETKLAHSGVLYPSFQKLHRAAAPERR